MATESSILYDREETSEDLVNITIRSSDVPPQELSHLEEMLSAAVSTVAPTETVTEPISTEQGVKRARTSSGYCPSEPRSTSDELLNTWLENVEFEPPLKRQQTQYGKPPSMKQQMIVLCKRYRIADRNQWRELCWQEDHEVWQFNNDNLHKYRYLETVDEASKLALFSIKPLTWLERVRQTVVPPSQLDKAEAYCKRFIELFEQLDDVKPLRVWAGVFGVMSRTARSPSKVRTVYLHGPASTGKSSVMQLLTSVYDMREIGRFGPQGSMSQFWLEDLINKEVYLGDEAPANPMNIQTYLLLLEGNSALKTEIKFGGKPSLLPKPVIVACNQHIYINCQAHSRAVLDRVYRLHLENRVPTYVDIRPDEQMGTYVLRLLYDKLCAAAEVERLAKLAEKQQE